MRSVPLQRKIKGCERHIIKLPDFKRKKKDYPLQYEFILPFCKECILTKGPKYRFSTSMQCPHHRSKWLL